MSTERRIVVGVSGPPSRKAALCWVVDRDERIDTVVHAGSPVVVVGPSGAVLRGKPLACERYMTSVD